MLNLLNAEFYKLRKGKSFFVGLLVAAAILLLLFSSLVMIDKISRGEIANGTSGVVVYQNGENLGEDGQVKSMSEEIGVIGVLQQMFGGHFVGLILAALISMFVIREFGSGAIKNLVGKGYSRISIFLSKLLASIALTAAFQTAVAALAIVMGLPFLGTKIYGQASWGDIAVYLGLQILFGVTITVIFVTVGELTRNLAAGIAVNMGILMFSTTLTAGLDLLFHGTDFQPSDYWVMDLMAGKCPLTDFKPEFLIRSILASAVWFGIAAVLGTVHFQKADVK